MSEAKFLSITQPQKTDEQGTYAMQVILQNISDTGWVGIGIEPTIGAIFTPPVGVELLEAGAQTYSVQFHVPAQGLSFTVQALSWNPVSGLRVDDSMRVSVPALVPEAAGLSIWKMAGLAGLVMLGLLVASKSK